MAEGEDAPPPPMAACSPVILGCFVEVLPKSGFHEANATLINRVTSEAVLLDDVFCGNFGIAQPAPRSRWSLVQHEGHPYLALDERRLNKVSHYCVKGIFRSTSGRWFEQDGGGQPRWVSHEEKPVDYMTKLKGNTIRMLDLLKTGTPRLEGVAVRSLCCGVPTLVQPSRHLDLRTAVPLQACFSRTK